MMRATAVVSTILFVAVSATALAANKATGTAASNNATQTRDWSAIDTNKDNYIEPSEMHAYLEKVWKQQGKKGQRSLCSTR